MLTAAPAATRQALPKAAHRDDITGMRAVAILLVVIFHAGVPGMSGGYVGVDVFYVISGFLITGLLVDELRATGSISLQHFYARRIRRLLPLASLVLVTTVIAARLILSPLDQGSIVGDAIAAAMWFANWHFAAGATQYMASTDQSPVLHYWSLSVEEQFYVVWPLLLLAVAGSRRRSWSVLLRRVVVALAAIFALSLAASILLTASTGQWAYFGLHTRGWELAMGAGLALARPVVPRLPRAVLGIAGIAGMVMILVSAVTFSRTTVFPGSAALLPVCGSVLLLAAGSAGSRYGASRLLALAPVVYVGEISYGWYLWHWPCLILGQAYSNGGTIGDASGAESVRSFSVAFPAIIGSFLLAAVTHRLVERPARRSRWLTALPLRSITAGALLISLVLVTSLVSRPSLPNIPTAAASTFAAADAPRGTVSTKAPAPLKMSPSAAVKDVVRDPACSLEVKQTEPTGTCQQGDPNGSRVVVLVGDSHAEHWIPALSDLAKRSHWRFYAFTKAACSFEVPRTYSTALRRRYTECETFTTTVVNRIKELRRVDTLVIGRSYGYQTLNDNNGILKGSAKSARWQQEAAKAFDSVRPAVRNIVVLRDTPGGTVRAPSCLARHLKDPAACSFAKKGSIRDGDQYDGEKVAAQGRPVSFVDLAPYTCPTSRCPVVDDLGVIIYRDAGHFTATFSRLQWNLFGHLIGRYVTG